MINTQHLTVHLVHEYIMDRPLSIDDLSDRVIAQKVVYLADELGVNCGDYRFTWYKKGPYSPALTKLLYENDEKNIYTEFSLSPSAIEVLAPLKTVRLYCPKELSEVDWMELVASLYYLYDNNGESIQKTVDKLVSLKPKYNKKQAFYALEILEANGVIC
ncbi:hypothetical protein ACYX6U_08975 [Bacillus cereus]